MFTYFAKQIYRERERDGETKCFIQLVHSLYGSGGGGRGGGGGAVDSAVCTSFLQHHVVQTYLESKIKYKIQQQQQKCTRQLHNDSSIVNFLTCEKEGLQRGKLDLAVSDSRLTHSLG